MEETMKELKELFRAEREKQKVADRRGEPRLSAYHQGAGDAYQLALVMIETVLLGDREPEVDSSDCHTFDHDSGLYFDEVLS